MNYKLNSDYIYERRNKGVSLAIFLIIASIAVLSFSILNQNYSFSGVRQFTSSSDLQNFIKTRTESPYYGGIFGIASASISPTMAGVSGEVQSSTGAERAITKSEDYSQTNIQVAGVDEPDIVKNDGKYIYTISNGKLLIVDAYPAEGANVVGKIEINGSVSDIFINGDKLVVFGSEYGITPPYYGITETGVATVGTAVQSSPTGKSISILPPRYYSPSTFVAVYDVSDRSKPILERNISLSGYFFDARMINDYVYVIATEPVYLFDQGPILPAVRIDGASKEISASSISYFDTYDSSFAYTNIMALNVKNKGEEPEIKVFLTGQSQNLFVSTDNIYITYTKWLSYKEIYKRIIENAILPNVPGDVQSKIKDVQNQNIEDYQKQNKINEIIYDYVNSLGPEQGAEALKKIEDATKQVMIDISKEQEKTFIHKISVSNRNIQYKATGNVPGRVLNQFSMDEYNGNFRIATTTGNRWGGEATTLNHVYVLDGNLNVIGKLEDIAKGEQIYSARFIGDKGYLVTFRRTDPLFVIDLSNPSNPKILGELKLPGFSDYLHPYDDTHLIGVGMETDSTGRITGQIKLSLFDVSDVSNPRELAKYLIGGNGTYSYSEALYDHKAFLFSKSKNLLVIPVNENNWQERKYDQGAYVFDLTLENGFNLKGVVTHQEAPTNETYYYGDYLSTVVRSLYMDNTLYTISNNLIKANSLSDLSFISQVNLKNNL